MVVLGMQNSRVKDFYDLWIIAKHFSFDGLTLVGAVRATFHRRGTEIPKTLPIALSNEFATDEYKVTQWKAFLERNQLQGEERELSQVVDELREFLVPVIQASESSDGFDKLWPEGGPWAPKSTNSGTSTS